MTNFEVAASEMRQRAYGAVVNSTLLSLFKPGSRVLDIGCGEGAWAEHLRSAGARELIGVELSPSAAEIAATRYDEIHDQPIERLDFSGRNIDTIIVADVLEHLVDPFEQISRWQPWARQLVVSVPNLQSLDIVGPLLTGRFSYTESGGLMDRTHLRWFTKRSLGNALTEAGWRPVTWGRPIGKRGLLGRSLGGQADGFLLRQLQVVATAEGSSSL